LPEFNRDLVRLLKRFRSLNDDLETFEKAHIRLVHELGRDNAGSVVISGLGILTPKIYKAKKFACKSLKGRGVMSGIRVIYSHFETENRIEPVEIYFKGDKNNEDKERIKRLYRSTR
jgi:hypothetical protein